MQLQGWLKSRFPTRADLESQCRGPNTGNAIAGVAQVGISYISRFGSPPEIFLVLNLSLLNVIIFDFRCYSKMGGLLFTGGSYWAKPIHPKGFSFLYNICRLSAVGPASQRHRSMVHLQGLSENQPRPPWCRAGAEWFLLGLDLMPAGRQGGLGWFGLNPWTCMLYQPSFCSSAVYL